MQGLEVSVFITGIYTPVLRKAEGTTQLGAWKLGEGVQGDIIYSSRNIVDSVLWHIRLFLKRYTTHLPLGWMRQRQIGGGGKAQGT